MFNFLKILNCIPVLKADYFDYGKQKLITLKFVIKEERGVFILRESVKEYTD